MIDLDVKRVFFDRKAVIDRMDAATRKVFSKFGAFVRRAARSSIRKRRSSAPPGSPPSSHTGLLKRFIFFGYDAQARSVVIGPARLDQRGRTPAATPTPTPAAAAAAAPTPAPSLLEHGGMATLTRRGTRRQTRNQVRYRPRPFMGPAFEKQKPLLAAMWRDSITRK
jgi:hypothetical protein